MFTFRVLASNCRSWTQRLHGRSQIIGELPCKHSRDFSLLSSPRLPFSVSARWPQTVIHFRGQIVEPPCDYQPSPTKMSVNCYQDGKNHVQTVSMKSLLQGQQFVNDKSTATLHWLNTDKNAAILTVQYK